VKRRWLFIYAGALALLAGYAAVEKRFVNAQVDRALEGADAAIAVAHAEIDRRGAIDADADGTLRAGRVPLSGDERVVDRIKELTGFDCTLFSGDERVASTARVRGGRNVGTRAPANIANRVLRRGETVRGQTYGRVALISRYDPLQTRDGRVVGMLAVYRATDDYLAGRGAFRLFFAGLFVLACGLAVAAVRRGTTSADT